MKDCVLSQLPSTPQRPPAMLLTQSPSALPNPRSHLLNDFGKHFGKNFLSNLGPPK